MNLERKVVTTYYPQKDQAGALPVSPASEENANGEPVQFNTPLQVFSALSTLTRDMEGEGRERLTVGKHTFSAHLLEALLHKFEEPQINSSFKEIELKYPGEPRPITNLLARKLNTASSGEFRGLVAIETAALLLVYLENLPSPKDNIAVPETVEEDLLTLQELDDVMYLVYDSLDEEKKGSIGHQITGQSFLEQASNGLVISPLQGDPPEHGFEIPQKLLDISRKLKSPESAHVLETWIYNNIVSNREGAIVLLEALTRFTIFLDTESALAIWDVSGPKINIQPFHSLYNGINSAITYLKSVGVTAEQSPELAKLIEIRELVVTTYSQVFIEKKPGKKDRKTPQLMPITAALRPSYTKLAERLTECCNEEGENSTYDLATYFASSILRQTRARPHDINLFMRKLETVDPNFADMVLRRLVLEGIIVPENANGSYPTVNDIRTAQSAEITRVHQELVEHPFIDAQDMDMSKLIYPSTRQVYLNIVTGTLGPFTPGHLAYLNHIFRYMDYQQSISSDPQSEQHLLLLLPVGRTAGTPYPKPFQIIGSAYERIVSVMLGTSGLLPVRDQKRFLMTLGLQPTINSVNSIEDRANATAVRFDAQITHQLTAAGRVVVTRPKFIFPGASDELNWDRRKDRTFILSRNQRSRWGHPSIVVTRPGYEGGMVASIESAERWRQILPQTRLILAKREPQSSTQAREDLRKDVTAAFPLTARKFLLMHYNRSGIRRRENMILNHSDQVSEEEDITISEAHQKLLEDIEKYGLFNY